MPGMRAVGELVSAITAVTTGGVAHPRPLPTSLTGAMPSGKPSSGNLKHEEETVIPELPVIARPSEPGCPVCMDRGFVTYDVPYGHPLFAKLKRCHCARPSGQAARGKTSPCRPAWHDGASPISSGIREAAAYDVAITLGRAPEGFFTVTGDTGVGESTLLAGIGNDALSAGFQVIYVRTADLFDELRNTFNSQRSPTSRWPGAG